MAGDVRRVLIADADSALRQQLYSLLLDHNIYSDCVSNTRDALEKLGAEQYGVVVLDVDIVQIVLRRPVNLSQLVDVVKSCLRSAGARANASPRKPAGKDDYVVS